MDSLLLDNNEEKESSVPESVLQNLLLKPEDLTPKEVPGAPPQTKMVIPEAGFCMKTWTDKKEKVFINICQSEQIPAPKDITDDQLDTLLESGDASQYRIPVSLGEPHTTPDNSGNECQAYDVIISSKLLQTVQDRSKMKDFLLTIILEGLEQKYDVRLSRDCRIMKNRTFMGHLSEQSVRKKSKPFIVEMGDRKTSSGGKEMFEEDQSLQAPEPQYTIAREPVDGEVPEFLVVEVHLPGIKSSRNICLEVGEDRMTLKTRPKLFFLDVDLPFLLDNDSTGAQFDVSSSKLTITLTVTAKAPV